VKGSEAVLNAAFDSNPVVDTVLRKSDLTDTVEYGYGFWLKFLTRYPA